MAGFESYITQEGDSVDLIAFNRFGEHGAESSIWNANPGLAAIGPVLPIGMTILIPLPEEKKVVMNDRLWG